MSDQPAFARKPVEILVVEDSATQAERLRHLLEQRGYHVAVVADGRPALAYLGDHQPALVISDINMPAMNGYELCQQIKGDPRLLDVPVILLTSLADAADVLEGLACGADSFITKPYSEEYLLARVERTLADQADPLGGRAGLEVEIPLPGQSRVISADPRRVVSLLTSTYEAAVYRNSELVQAQEALRSLNEHLEDLVAERTTVLMAEIAERNRAEAALAQTNDLLSRAEELGQLGSWQRDILVDRVVWSDGLYRILGLSPAAGELTYAAFLACVHPDDRERVRHATEKVYLGSTPLEFESRIIRPDGTVRLMYTRAAVIRDQNGLPAYISGSAIDVTERKQREREVEAIAAVSTALRAAKTAAEMLPLVLEQVMALLGASAAAVALSDPATDELVMMLGQGEMAAVAGQRVPAGAGIGGQVLATGQPYVSDDFAADAHFYQIHWAMKARAAACVPLITGRQALGVLWAVRAAGFTEVEVHVLSAIAGIAANAIQRAALHEQTEERLRRLGALREIDSAIMNSMDLGTTLFILLGHVTDQLGVDACDILLLHSGMSVLEFSAGRGFRSRLMERSRLRLGEGHAGQAALERRLVAAPDLRADPDPPRRAELLAGEAFAAQFCVPLLAKGQVVGVLEVFHRAPLNPDADWLVFLETLAGQAAIAVADAWLFNDLQRSNTELLLAYDTTLEGWSAALDLRDKETEGHSQRVTEMTLQLARALGLVDGDLEQIRRGALLHDIGKMAVPDAILLKPGKLTDAEWVIMRQHPSKAYELLSPIGYLRPALDIPYCHHEKWDGSGYPRHLKGEAIPFAARIFAVVDVWDALRSDRPYRAGWPDDQVVEYLSHEAGKHFDPAIVAAFLTLRASVALAVAPNN